MQQSGAMSFESFEVATLADRLVFRVLMIMMTVQLPHFVKFDIGYCFDRAQFSYELQGL
jgi:hypothetical protein